MSDFKFYVQDHNKVQETVDVIIGSVEACHFCQKAPITIVYRGFDDKVVAACKEHEEIVMEMIEKQQ